MFLAGFGGGLGDSFSVRNHSQAQLTNPRVFLFCFSLDLENRENLVFWCNFEVQAYFGHGDYPDYFILYQPDGCYCDSVSGHYMVNHHY